MPGLFDIPEGTDKIAIRKKINSMLSEARKNAKPDMQKRYTPLQPFLMA